jgi:formylglycine-generating enzyme required for sulfatase activity
MITRDERAKILDFGLATLVERRPDDPTLTALGTRTGLIMGTAAYMSPEQAQGRPVTTRSDVFSLGAVLYEEFQRFVDAGGYRDPKYWNEPFRDGSRLLTFEEMARFRDATGRLGPATWELETCPSGQDDFPVGGISWFEAAAYAGFAGKSLPTLHQWYPAASPQELYSVIIRLSNPQIQPVFSVVAPGPRGASPVSVRRQTFTTNCYDMAGNVKEWVSNGVTNTSLRYILVGAWNGAGLPLRRAGCAAPMAARADVWRAPGEELWTHERGCRGARGHRGGKSEECRSGQPQELEIYKRFYEYDRTQLFLTVRKLNSRAASPTCR